VILLSSGVPFHDFYRNFCGVCAVTVVIFGHLNCFLLLTYNLWAGKECCSKFASLYKVSVCLSVCLSLSISLSVSVSVYVCVTFDTRCLSVVFSLMFSSPDDIGLIAIARRQLAGRGTTELGC